jgi:hypothetical protein
MAGSAACCAAAGLGSLNNVSVMAPAASIASTAANNYPLTVQNRSNTAEAGSAVFPPMASAS